MSCSVFEHFFVLYTMVVVFFELGSLRYTVKALSFADFVVCSS